MFHEIGHILNGDLGISFQDEKENEADLYVQRTLIRLGSRNCARQADEG